MYPDSSLAPSCRMPAKGIETKPGHIMVFAWVGRLMLIFCAPAFFADALFFWRIKCIISKQKHILTAHIFLQDITENVLTYTVTAGRSKLRYRAVNYSRTAKSAVC